MTAGRPAGASGPHGTASHPKAGYGGPIPILFGEHHLSHAANVYLPSPYDRAAVTFSRDVIAGRYP